MAGKEKHQEYSMYLDSWAKRSFDIAMSLLLLPPALIIMGLASLNILIREGRPVFFVHRRAGRNGKPFWLPKLRTLTTDADPYEPLTEPDKDLLVTRTGKPLRRHRLDELPQLFSVLAGHMSLVGPRPELPNVVTTYKSVHKKRLLTKPGITGLWQIMGNHNLEMHHDMKYDLYYLREASLWLDVKILGMTLRFVFNPKWKHPYESRIYTHHIPQSDRDFCGQRN